MSVDRKISISIVQKELQECRNDPRLRNVKISEIDEDRLLFNVEIQSTIDNEKYLSEIMFDNYREIPLFIEFIHPITGEKGSKNAYPKNKDSFFHPHPCICNPCSRKAYSGPHGDWKMVGWRNNPQVGGLTTIASILYAIYRRINNRNLYQGRMC